MDLEELLVDGELHQDRWSLSGPVAGKDGQISVLGWSYKTRTGTKLYVIHCKTCANDPELFGGGFFKIRKADLINNLLSCGCGRRHKWSEAQYKIKISRALEGSTVSFVDWCEPYADSQTRIRAFCNLHGPFETAMSVGDHLSRGVCAGMCLQCSIIKAVEEKTAVIDDLLTELISLGGYEKGTTIRYRSTEESPISGMKSRRWDVYCPVCNVTYQARTTSIVRGSLGCDCVKARIDQTKAYINKVYDRDELICLKFGISNDPVKRRSQIQTSTEFDVILTDIFSFDTSQDCRKAERICKETLECQVVEKNDLTDGYTETTSIDNYSLIVNIYEETGGKRLDLVSIYQ